MSFLEKIVAIKIKKETEKYLLADLMPFFGTKFAQSNVIFSKKEYEVFLKEKRVREIFGNHRVRTTITAETIPNAIFKGSFTDRNGEYAHIYVECN